MDNTPNRRADDKRAAGELQWGESVGAALAGAGFTATIAAAPVIVPDIVMHGLRITKDGITYNGQEVRDAGIVYAAMMDFLSGKPLPARAAGSASPAAPGLTDDFKAKVLADFETLMRRSGRNTARWGEEDVFRAGEYIDPKVQDQWIGYSTRAAGEVLAHAGVGAASKAVHVGTLSVYEDKEATFGHAYDISTNMAGHKALQDLDGAELYALAAPSSDDVRNAASDKHLPGWERGIATVTLSGHQLREALDFINPDGDDDEDQRDNELTFGIVQHKDDDGAVATGMCCWNEDTDGVLPLDGAPDDQAFDRNAERLTREAGLGGGSINPNATSVLDLFVDDKPAAAQSVSDAGDDHA